jgi:Fe-S oxidoreductase
MRMMADGGTRQDRLGWLTDDLHTEPSKGEVFYWTGCVAYYDAFFTEFELTSVNAARAAIRLMNRLDVVPVVSPEERCCGHDLLWNGDRENFEKLARHNVRLVEQSGAKKLVVSCAECLRTWKIDYQPLFTERPPEIVHVTEFLAPALDGLAESSDRPRRVTFQDPCRLGRHLGIYDPPREALAAIPGLELVEMRHARHAATCCAGGTWSHCDRFAKRIQVERLREAKATGAEVLATACPKCQIHLKCAMKDPNLGDDIQIELRDVVELMAEVVDGASAAAGAPASSR